jgi:hypothetical protein
MREYVHRFFALPEGIDVLKIAEVILAHAKCSLISGAFRVVSLAVSY